jgi:ADP-heptose:LPS heptosyltransferase
MQQVKIDSYLGLGDNVYMRPFALALAKQHKVDVVTPFPDFLYSGTPVGCIKPNTQLKTQKEYAEKTSFKWRLPLAQYKRIYKPNYSHNFHNGKNIIESFREHFQVEPESFQFDIPQSYKAKAKRLVKSDKPICFLRLPTIRKEWLCSSRNAPMSYFQYVINKIKDTHYVVSCLDLRNGEEWLDGALPSGIDLCLHQAELDVNGMLGLMAISDCMIGIQSNLIPLSCAMQKPCFIIYGGYVPHEVLVDPYMGLSKLRHIQPENFCFCINGRHKCNKQIGADRLNSEFNKFKKEILCLQK